jgi:hypothetical protein
MLAPLTSRRLRPHDIGAVPYNRVMHIIVIAWLYVTVLMALAESSVVAGILTLLFYGLVPTALLLWLFGGPVRRRAARLSQGTAATTSDADTDKPAQ